MQHVLILNGPNLNMLGVREPAIYGTASLAHIEELCLAKGQALGLKVDFRQTNDEAQILKWIHGAREVFDAIIINGAAWTHTSLALHDALKVFEGIIVEVHLSDPLQREAFRHFSYITPVAAKVFSGHGSQSYVMALEWLAMLPALHTDQV